jgi:hypothetical protein
LQRLDGTKEMGAITEYVTNCIDVFLKEEHFRE